MKNKVAYTSAILVFLVWSCRESKDDDDCIFSGCPSVASIIDEEPSWSPDGLTIAYVHNDSSPDSTGIYLIDTLGSNKRIIFSGPGAYTPSWSPSGEWLAFSYNAQIYKIKSTGDSLTQITTQGNNFSPSWSPDGLWIAYDSDFNSSVGFSIWKVKIDGTDPIRIAYDSLQGEIRMPSWSKTGNICHIRFLQGTSSSEIFTMNPSGGNAIRITFNNYRDWYPKFSPDGTKIVYQSQPDVEIHVWVANADGTGQIQVTVDQGYSPEFSPNGMKIVYTRANYNDGHLWIMDSDGSNKHQITY